MKRIVRRRDYRRVLVLVLMIVGMIIFNLVDYFHTSEAHERIQHISLQRSYQTQTIRRYDYRANDRRPQCGIRSEIPLRYRQEKAQSIKANKNYETGEIPHEEVYHSEELPRRIYDFLTSKGCSHEASIGILANIEQESKMGRLQDQLDGSGKGLFQFEGNRYLRLLEFADSKGTYWKDVDTQLEYMWSELHTDDMNERMKGHISPGNMDDVGISGHPKGVDGFKEVDDIYYATALFEAAYERAGEPMIHNRYAAAEMYDKMFRK